MRKMNDLFNPPWLREMKKMNDLFNPPWLREMKKMNDLFNPPWLREMKKTADVVDPPFLRQMKAMRDAIAPASALTATAALLSRDSVSEASFDALSRSLASIATTTFGRALCGVVLERPDRSTVAAGALSVLARLDIGESVPDDLQNEPTVLAVREVQRAAEQSRSLDELAQKLSETLEGVGERLSGKEQPAARGERRLGIASFIVALVALVLQIRYSELSERRARKQELDSSAAQQISDERAARLQAAVDKLVALQLDASSGSGQANQVVAPALTFCVSRSVVMRERPDSHSKRLAVLQPGELLDVDKRSRHWARVNLVDQVRGTIRPGWVLKKYISRCDR
jgi:hypothetical protein